MSVVWVRWLEDRDRGNRTVQAYRGDLSQFRIWFEARNGEVWDASRVTSLDVREWRRGLLEVCSPATVNRKLSALSSFFRWGVEDGLLVGSPMVCIEHVKQQRSAPRWLERAEQRRVVRALEIAVQGAQSERARWRALRDRAMVMLMLHAGLRVAEVAGARMTSLVLRSRSGVLTIEGKGGKWRTVPLNASVRKALRSWLDVRSGEGDAIFESQKGLGIDAASVWRRVHRIGEQAGVEGLTPHRFRHSFAKGLVDAGVGLPTVAELLGHSRLQTTMIYTRPGARDLADAVERVAWADG